MRSEPSRTVLITGAAGNLGAKLRHHLEGRYPLRLVDRVSNGSDGILAADLSQWDQRWADQFQGVATVVHLAADAAAHHDWPKLIGPNVDAVVHVLHACARAGIARVVYASSNHTMGGYQQTAEPARLTTDLPPRPGLRFGAGREWCDSTAYATSKLLGERLGRCYAELHGQSFLAVRIGWVQPGANRAADLPREPPRWRLWAQRLRAAWRGRRLPPEAREWFRLMWLSNRDFCQLMECCIRADPALRFAIVNGMSANTGMRWDLDHTRRLLGYEPQDDVNRPE